MRTTQDAIDEVAAKLKELIDDANNPHHELLIQSYNIIIKELEYLIAYREELVNEWEGKLKKLTDNLNAPAREILIATYTRLIQSFKGEH
jgi:hypothetical protein